MLPTDPEPQKKINKKKPPSSSLLLECQSNLFHFSACACMQRAPLFFCFISVFLHGVDGAPVVVHGWHGFLLHDTAGRWKRGQERGEEKVPICLVGARDGQRGQKAKKSEHPACESIIEHAFLSRFFW